MPFAQWGFPHQNKEAFRASFPADFISEAVDQTRGWFYSLLMISTLLFDDEGCAQLGLEKAGFPRPYRNCVVLGHVCDMDGKKESKSKGNYTPPGLIISGKMRLRAVADESLQPGQVGLRNELVRSVDLGKKERFHVLVNEERILLDLVVADVQARETAHLHPEDLERLSEDGWVELVAPFPAPGADAFRWLFYASNPPWSNTRLSLRGIREGQREFLLRLRNVHSFFAIYANIAGFDPNETPRSEPESREILDRWILQEFEALRQRVTERMDAYRLYEAARDIQEFVDGLSNWYVRRSRRRFWGDAPQDALWTLYEVLTATSRLIAPFVPFMAEALYQDLEGGQEGAQDSVHHCAWPEPGPSPLGPDLSKDMALLRELASLGLSARSRVGVRVRQPLAAMEVILAEPERAEGLRPLLGMLAEELNVREVRFAVQADLFVDFKVKPNFPVLGKKLGKDMKACAAALGQRAGAEVRAAILGEGLTLELPGGTVVLGPEDVVVEVQPKGSFQAAGSAMAVVALHSELDEDLKEEGLAREVVNRIQTRRKEMDLGYTDRIHVALGGDLAVLQAVERFRDHLSAETLAVGWEDLSDGSGSRELDVDGHRLLLEVRRA
jgi:isoleucyl-tRNA synthetase